MTDVFDRVRDRYNVDRRTFLAAGAAAAVLAGGSRSFAQDQPPDASAQAIQAVSNSVRIERLDGSILLIGIGRQK